MNTSEIEALLRKYYEGETSLAEEKLLKDFFSRDDVPANLLPHQPIFRFFTSEALVSSSDDMQDKSLGRRLDQYLADTGSQSIHPAKRRMFYMSGLAAGLLILLSLVFALRNEVGNSGRDAIASTSVEEAYAETTHALLLVSVGLNTGLSALQGLQTMGNAMDQVQRINKMYYYQNQFINPERIQYPSLNK